jgi:Spy/CpxP family protein refolding chaperone
MRVAITLFVLLIATFALADTQSPKNDPVGEQLFPPELVMRHATAIGLDDRQRATIKEAVQKAQARFLDLQWDMQGEAEKMVRLLQARPVDEAAVLAQADRVMGLERDIKKAQLSLLVRIKNTLSGAQHEKLQTLRATPQG